jgi:hypothetical protein
MVCPIDEGLLPMAEKAVSELARETLMQLIKATLIIETYIIHDITRA